MDPKAFLAKMKTVGFTPKAIVREPATAEDIKPIPLADRGASFEGQLQPEPETTPCELCGTLRVDGLKCTTCGGHKPSTEPQGKWASVPVPDLSMFEIREIIRDKARRFHRANPPNTGGPQTWCACGEPTGGPAGTEVCQKLAKAMHNLWPLECELSRWEHAASIPGGLDPSPQEPDAS